MAFYTDTASAPGSVFGRMVAAWDRYKANADKRAAYKTTVHELRALSDRELADLGLHRSHIKRIAYEAAYLG